MRCPGPQTLSDPSDLLIKLAHHVPLSYAKGARVRPDGLLEHDFYLMEVKKLTESKRASDY
jgi:branched-chain amino acid transport system substrate-binding protein